MNKIITSFGTGYLEPNTEFYNEIFEIGKVLGHNNITVCSGGYYGSMEAISKGVKLTGGKTIGVTVKGWKSGPNKYIDEVVEMPNLMERITELITIADLYIIFKGGTGTLSEIALTL
jgi:uncharacterized protein (TIGR00725 family)